MKRNVRVATSVVVIVVSVLVTHNVFAAFAQAADAFKKTPALTAEEQRVYMQTQMASDEKMLTAIDKIVETNKNTQDLLNQLNLTMQQTNALLTALAQTVQTTGQDHSIMLDNINKSIASQLFEQRKLNDALNVNKK